MATRPLTRHPFFSCAIVAFLLSSFALSQDEYDIGDFTEYEEHHMCSKPIESRFRSIKSFSWVRDTSPDKWGEMLLTMLEDQEVYVFWDYESTTQLPMPDDSEHWKSYSQINGTIDGRYLRSMYFLNTMKLADQSWQDNSAISSSIAYQIAFATESAEQVS